MRAANQHEQQGFERHSGLILGIAIASCMGLIALDHPFLAGGIGLPIGFIVQLLVQKLDAARKA